MTKPYRRSALALIWLMTAGSAIAQAQSAPPAPTSSPQVSAEMLSGLPEPCRKAAQASPMMQNMQGMMGAAQAMPMSANVPGASREYMDAMRKMDPPMMSSIAISDPELAFLCAMIPHHRGAVEMAEAVLKHTKDPDIRKNAEKTIKDQRNDIEELTKLANKHSK